MLSDALHGRFFHKGNHRRSSKNIYQSRSKSTSRLFCGHHGFKMIFYSYRDFKYHNKNLKYHISFLARGEHLQKIKDNGLKLQTSDGNQLICKPTIASNDPMDFPTPNLCLICVKSYDLDDLIFKIKNKLNEETIIIPLMNGIDIYERIRNNLNKSIVLPSCVYLGSHIEKPGLVIQSGNPGFFCCGPDPKHSEFNPRIIIDFFNEMNIELKWKDDPYPSIWEKYLLVASFALVCTHTGKPMGGVINNTSSILLLRDVMSEILLISEKKGIKLPKNIIEKTIEFCKNYPDVKPSYMRDVEKGSKNEGDLFGGAIINMGKELGIHTPVISSIYKN